MILCLGAYWPATLEEKLDWITFGSDPKDNDPVSYGTGFILDNNLATYYESVVGHFPWIGIEFQSSQMVKGLRITGI